MALTTYTELKTAIADWLNRTDLESVIPTFISLAESGFERELRTRQMMQRATGVMDAQYITLPNDFLEVRAMKLLTNPPHPLSFITKDEMDKMDAESYASGRPDYYTITGNQIRVHPYPDASYTPELQYYKRISKLSDSSATNWVLSAHPDLYLYGSLVQSAPYLKDDARIGVWNSLYAGALEALKISDERSVTTGGSLVARTRPFGVR